VSKVRTNAKKSKFLRGCFIVTCNEIILVWGNKKS
jgi:hypothetical protein